MSGKRVSLVLIAICSVLMLIFLYIFFTGNAIIQFELLKSAGTLIIQLLLLGILGAFATFLFTRYAAERDKQIEKRDRENALQESQHKLRLEALNTLTTLYWEIRKAFDIIDAHRSAKSYGEQMRQIIDYRIALQHLDNEIVAGMYALKDTETIGKYLSDLIHLLKDVLDEWKTEYLRLSRLQSLDEKQADPTKKLVPKEIDKSAQLNWHTSGNAISRKCMLCLKGQLDQFESSCKMIYNFHKLHKVMPESTGKAQLNLS